MNAKQLVIVSVIAIAAGAALAPVAFAADGSSLTRAEVRAEVLAARASHELVASGEASLPIGAATAFEPSYLARATVKDETRMARAHGELIPSGQGFGPTEGASSAHREPSVALRMPWKR